MPNRTDVGAAVVDGTTGTNPAPTPQHRRILRLMGNDDLIWEVVGKRYCSIYNEKLGRPQRVPASVVAGMEQQGWIRRLPNPDSARLDGWELTPEGRALAAKLRTRRNAKAQASSL